MNDENTDEVRDAVPVIVYRRPNPRRTMSLVVQVGEITTNDGRVVDIVQSGLTIAVRYGGEELYINLWDICKTMANDLLVVLKPKQ